MGKRYDAIKKEALLAVAEQATRTPNKARAFSQQALLGFAKISYEAYVKAVTDFKTARDKLVDAKKILQDDLNERVKVDKSQCWDFILDEDGNMFYRNSDKDYVIRYNKYKDSGGKTEYDDNLLVPQGTSGGTSGGTLGKQYTPPDTSNADVVHKWYQDYARDGVPANWQSCPPVELNMAGIVQAKKSRWKAAA